jgi:fumarylpyruvate hydrolase
LLKPITSNQQLQSTQANMNTPFTAPPATTVPIKGTDMVYPVRRVFCVGRNYVEHAQEMGFTGREPPFFFMKPTDAVTYVAEGTVGNIPYPSLTSNYHYEAELVVCIGKAGKNIQAADAAQYIYGYAIGLDMTRRDLQIAMRKEGRPWDIGKGFDHSAPIGPITRKEDCGEYTAGNIWLDVNGTRKQNSDLKKLIWNINEVIEHLSAAWEIAPGDIIYSGTPEGVGAVVAGDSIKMGVDRIGVLEIKVI